LTSIQQTGRKMLNLVMNLLDISKYEKQAMKVSVEPVVLKPLINEALVNVSYMAEQKSINFETNIPGNYKVKANPEIIERVFINLFSNAINFSPNGKSVKVFTESSNPSIIKVIVKDQGEGIAAENLSLIFDRFNQVRSKHSASSRSTGLGLSFCKMAVEAHGGEIGADSVVGQGSTFWFTLPLAVIADQLFADFVEIEEKPSNTVEPVLNEDEIKFLIPYCEQLKQISIHQISDVKDVLKTIDFTESENLLKWKSRLIKALTDCNEIEYYELLKLKSNG